MLRLIFLLSMFSLIPFHELQDCNGKKKGITLILHYHFQPLHRHLDISWVITAGSSPLRTGSSQTRTGNVWFPTRKSLTTKLRALGFIFDHVFDPNMNKLFPLFLFSAEVHVMCDLPTYLQNEGLNDL